MSRKSVGRFAVLAVICSVSCHRSEQPPYPPPADSRSPTEKDYRGPPLPKGRVILKDAYGGAHQADVEIAATSASRTRGLMWRQSLTDGTGMLFIFPNEQVQSFWMANTLISLDMIFINSQKRIVGIVQQAQPQTTTSRSVGQPSRYVLEVPGGWAEKNGISPTSEVELQGTSMIAVE